MILLASSMLLVGVFLSAFFSGSETGFYRASRVRLVMDGLEGDRVSRWLLKLTNNPAYFVATALVGNNLANYLTSLAIVLLTRSVSINDSAMAEMVAPLVFAPFLFVYGELMPKNLFFRAPNRLLRRAGPLILACGLVFAPIAALLWGLAQVMERVLGQSPSKVRLNLARKELQDVLDEGQAAGLLHPAQRQLGQNFFLVAARPIQSVCTPLARVQAVAWGTSYETAIRFARRRRLADIPIYRGQRNQIVGYVRTIDLLLADAPDRKIESVKPLNEIPADELFGEALLQMQTNRQSLCRIVDQQQQTLGLLSIDQLLAPLLEGPLQSLLR